MRIYRRALILFIVLASTLAWGQDTPTVPTLPEPVAWDLYVRTSDQVITIGWDPVTFERPIWYELLFYNLERRAWFARANVPQERTTFDVTLRSGHYIVYIRTGAKDAENADVFSEWCSSISETCTDGTAKWWVYTYLAPPGPIQ